MANDAPKLNGFNFTHPPDSINVYWEPQLIKHELADGSLAVYNKGFILKGSLEWAETWLNADEYSNVTVMYNEFTATAKFYPRFNTYPSRYFLVQITNEFNFQPHGGHLQGGGGQLYGGSITFESSIGDITATAGAIY
jgi:hypothetical protein